MTNEEKAKDMTKCLWYIDKCTEEQLQELLVEMAAWKDEQFANEKSALINRIFQEFEFENFTYVDIDGSLGFDYDKFAKFLDKVAK